MLTRRLRVSRYRPLFTCCSISRSRMPPHPPLLSPAIVPPQSSSCDYYPKGIPSLAVLARVYTTIAASNTHTSFDKKPIQVGGTFQVNLSAVDAEVDISTGANFEEIELKALWKQNLSGTAAGAFDIVTKNNLVSLEMHHSESMHQLLKLGAIMPGRWCNLVLSAGKGLVQVQSLKDADLIVNTTGGGIKLGQLLGNKAVIESRGGFFTAGLVSAVLEVKTDGGNLSIDKAIGTTMQMDSGGGNVAIGSVYGDDIHVISRGGDVEMKHLQAHSMAHISSNGGLVKISGLDGNIRIASDGGNVELQLLSNAQEVIVNAGSGDVMLFVTSEENIEIVVDETGNALQEDTAKESNMKDTGRSEKKNSRVVISSSGNITTKKRSWLESVMQSKIDQPVYEA